MDMRTHFTLTRPPHTTVQPSSLIQAFTEAVVVVVVLFEVQQEKDKGQMVICDTEV